MNCIKRAALPLVALLLIGAAASLSGTHVEAAANMNAHDAHVVAAISKGLHIDELRLAHAEFR
jgi:ABC-type Fe3+ transport system permease subunit